MAILANQKVLTLDYWKPASKLRVGDYIFNKDGQIVQVKLIQEYRAQTCYEVLFNDYLTAAGDDKLGFLVETPKYRQRICEYQGKKKFRRPLKFVSVDKLVDTNLKNHANRLIYSVPTTKPLSLPRQDLPVEPFIFGFWFFNRRANRSMAAPRGTFKFVEQKFKDAGYKLVIGKKINTGEREFVVSPSIESQLAPNIPAKIPENYLLASAEQRTELLCGILYAKSRQYSKAKDQFRFTSINYGLMLQVQGLVESLGHKTKVQFDDTYRHYTISFKSRTKLVENQVSPPIKVHQARRYITKITPIAAQMCVHIETTGQDNSFLVGEGFISCH
jgi:hypothetical protein